MKRYPVYKYFWALVDWLALNAAFLVALKLQTRVRISPLLPGFSVLAPEVLFFWGYALAVILIFQYNHLYKINVLMTIGDQALRILQGIFYAGLGLGLLSFFTRFHFIIESRRVIGYFCLLSIAILLLLRLLILRNLFSFLARKGFYRRLTLVVGAGSSGRLFAAQLGFRNPYALQIVGFVDEELPTETAVFRGLKILGKVADVPTLVDQYRIEEVLICLDNLPHDRLLGVLDICRSSSAVVKVASPLYDVIPARVFTERYGEIPVVGVYNSFPGFWRPFFKRAFDFSIAATGLLFLSPLFAIVAVAIKLDSRGPVLYLQDRIGKDGKPFRLYKFRSMFVDSD